MRRRGLLAVAVFAAATFSFIATGAWAASPPSYVTPEAAGAASAWPHTLHGPQGDLTVYQPQAESWPDRKLLTARAAVEVTPKAGKEILGTIEVSLATTVDDAAGVVHLADPKLISSHFPSLDTQRAAALQAKISDALPQMQTREVPLASVLLSLDQTPAPSVPLRNDPPKLFYSDAPASLVVFDGAPVLAPAGKSGLLFAVNTNWEVFRAGDTWYLLDAGMWLAAPAAAGPYKAVGKLPAAFNGLPADASFADARKAMPAKLPPPSVPVPTIFVSTEPADIVVTEGAPAFAAVTGTALRRVTNTPNTLFLDSRDNMFYLLLAGRWFAAGALQGPWRFASDDLPADFALIPPDAPETAVLASVPGTTAAQEAVLKAQIPTTVALKRDGAKLTVVYSGTPRFQPIPGTMIAAAVNTHSTVLKIGARYYACENGAWFVAASPTGPWALADSVPPEVKAIPPSSPYYNVTYVQVYGATPQAVTYGYTAGYVMGFVTAGVLVYGTGYYYPPVVVPGAVPVFYPYPYTYAGNVWYSSATGAWVRGGSVWAGSYGAAGARYYNPSTGAFGRGGAVWGPYGGAGAWSYYNPGTGSYARGSAAWGGGSGVANASYYNARTGVSGSTNQNWNPYGRWGSSTFSGPNQTVNTQSRSNANGSAGSFQSSTGAEGAGYHNRATGSSGGAVKTQNGDVYAGRDGNVYKNTGSGWSKWSDGGWNPVTPPSNAGSRNRQAPASGTNGTQARRGSVDSSSWQQLQQDRVGRQFGQGQYRGRAQGGGGGSGSQYRRGRFQR